MAPLPRMYPFAPGSAYSRRDIQQVLGLDPDRKLGGNWTTGYTRFGDDHFVFVNVGTAGRTGHDYDNRWIGDGLLRWYGKTGTRATSPSIRAMTGGSGLVYFFWRSTDRSPFLFAGLGQPERIGSGSPVEVVWRIRPPEDPRPIYPDDLPSTGRYLEGAVKTVKVNRYERDPEARKKCIEHWGARCLVCDIDFGERFGVFGEGFIHVHHCRPLGENLGEYEVDPIEDLRPVCPNCHAMIHRHDPILRVEELRELLLERQGAPV